MTEITPSDWDTLQHLAGRLGLPPDQVGALRRRLEVGQPRPGNPYTLLVGRPDAGVELLLARWLGPEAAEELQKVGGCPLVIGAAPAEVRPRLGAWPGWKSGRFRPGHLLVLRAAGKPTASTLAQLASLGHVDQMVLVTRLGQPLHQQERQLAEALAGVAATVRILVVGLPGEEPTATDLAEVAAFAVSQMRQAGFTGGRCLGAGVWFTDGGPRPGTFGDVGAFLAVNERAAAACRAGMAREAVASLLDDLRRQADRQPAAPQAAITAEEQDRLVRDLTGYLSDLGRELGRVAEKRRPLTADALRTYALDTIRGWGAYSSVEGHWLKYVERLRPGTQAAFLEEARSAVALLDYEPGKEAQPVPAAPATSALTDRLVVEAKRLAVGLGCGLVTYLLVAALLRGQAAGTTPDPAALPPLVVTLFSYATLTVATVLGYAVGRAVFRQQAPPLPAGSKEGVPAAVHGWEQVGRRLAAWFSQHIRASPVSPAEECRALAERWNIRDTEP